MGADCIGLRTPTVHVHPTLDLSHFLAEVLSTSRHGSLISALGEAQPDVVLEWN